MLILFSFLGMDPWAVLPQERLRYQQQFDTLKPINGVVTGTQAKDFFLQSQLPPLILGQIWYGKTINNAIIIQKKMSKLFNPFKILGPYQTQIPMEK